jgi:predicted component of type VI protein secretion system
MGKGTKLPEAAVKKVRAANRNLVKANKDLAAAVQALVKKSKAKSAAAKQKAIKNAYATVAKRNPLLRAAMTESLKNLGIG